MAGLDKAAGLAGNLYGIITLVAFVVGLGVTWGTLTSRMSTLETNFAEYKEGAKEKITKLENQVYQLELGKVSSDIILKNIDTNVTELKDEVKKLNKGH
jgi:hypothetical protein